MSTNVAVWVGALLSLGAYSFLVIGENPGFSIAEHLVVGTAAGHAIAVGVANLRGLAFVPLANGKASLLIPIVLGIFLYMRYVPRLAWLSRISVGFIVALASGVGAAGAIQSQVISQIRATILPPNTFSNLVVIVGVISVLWYFFLSFKQGSVGSGISRVGRWVMMAAFGAGFASTVMGRYSMLIGHCQFLLYTWLGLKP